MAELERTHTGDDNLDRIQDRIQEALQNTVSPTTGGTTVKGVSVLAAEPKDVPHKLGRPWTGAYLVRVADSTSVTICCYDSDDNSKFVRVQASADATVDILVY